MHTELTHADLDSTLYTAGADIPAAEFHGLVCGLLAAPTPAPLGPVLLDVLADHGLEADHGAGLEEVFDELATQTGLQLEDVECAFRPLLPEHEDPLPDRVQALADWCRGFLFGLAQGGAPDFSGTDDDAAEVAGDLAAISMLDATPGEPDAEQEEQERDLVELEEYVRVGVQLIYLQLRDKNQEDETEADRV